MAEEPETPQDEQPPEGAEQPPEEAPAAESSDAPAEEPATTGSAPQPEEDIEKLGQTMQQIEGWRFGNDALQ